LERSLVINLVATTLF